MIIQKHVQSQNYSYILFYKWIILYYKKYNINNYIHIYLFKYYKSVEKHQVII